MPQYSVWQERSSQYFLGTAIGRRKFVDEIGIFHFKVVKTAVDLWHTICFLCGYDYHNIAVEVDMSLNRI